MTEPPAVVGWDIGGVNTKAARVQSSSEGPGIRCLSLPYEMQLEPGALIHVLTSVARRLGVESSDRHAVTMTAELSQAFRTKREGVDSILAALEKAFSSSSLHVYTVDGRFVSPPAARSQAHAVAASNWAATANWVARSIPTCILMDIGSTSTDLIPIVNRKVVAQGRTDPERLLSGELVYSGAVRTPVEAILQQVPLWGGKARVSAEGFALIGDAHLWLGRLNSEHYTCRTPDGRPATREYAGERLARVVCGDREMLDRPAIDSIAQAAASAQVKIIAEALERIRERWPAITAAAVAGLGDFIAAAAAEAAGLSVLPLTDLIGDAAQTAPAAAVAWLLWQTGSNP